MAGFRTYVTALMSVLMALSGTATPVCAESRSRGPAIAKPAPPLRNGWERVSIPEVGTIDIPPTMEVLGGLYAAFRKRTLPTDTPLGDGTHAGAVTIHQKGLNELSPDARKRYVRVMVSTQNVRPGEVNTLYEGLAPSRAELENLSEAMRDEIAAQSRGSTVRLLEWYRPEVVDVGGAQALRFSFRRQLGSNPPVLVAAYMFQNHDRIHRLTMSYRESEKHLWASDFPPILSSFRITNIRSPADIMAEGPVWGSSSLGSAALVLVISAVLTWGIGLSVPLLLRYALIRKPLSKVVSLVIVALLGVVNLVIFVSLGSQSKTHAALFLVGVASYYILRAGSKREQQPQGRTATKPPGLRRNG